MDIGRLEIKEKSSINICDFLNLIFLEFRLYSANIRSIK